MKDACELLDLLNNTFLSHSVEVSIISSEINMRQTFIFKEVLIKSSILWLKEKESRYLTIDISSLESWHHYGPDSLVFILGSGSTITLRQIY